MDLAGLDVVGEAGDEEGVDVRVGGGDRRILGGRRGVMVDVVAFGGEGVGRRRGVVGGDRRRGVLVVVGKRVVVLHYFFSGKRDLKLWKQRKSSLLNRRVAKRANPAG